MANIQHIKDSITVMRRVLDNEKAQFDIYSWQQLSWGGVAAINEEQLTSCGTSACYAGWMAVSKEGRAAGLYPSMTGAPRLTNSKSQDAVSVMANYLGVTPNEARELIAPVRYACTPNPADVIERLYRLLDKYEGPNNV